jgi:hypothetical protein
VTEPLVAPAEKPLPVQDVAFFDVHVSVAEPPDVIEVGETVNVADGTEETVGTQVCVQLVPI